jgi:chaperonin cofactor prefoldin
MSFMQDVAASNKAAFQRIEEKVDSINERVTRLESQAEVLQTFVRILVARALSC